MFVLLKKFSWIQSFIKTKLMIVCFFEYKFMLQSLCYQNKVFIENKKSVLLGPILYNQNKFHVYTNNDRPFFWIKVCVIKNCCTKTKFVFSKQCIIKINDCLFFWIQSFMFIQTMIVCFLNTSLCYQKIATLRQNLCYQNNVRMSYWTRKFY